MPVGAGGGAASGRALGWEWRPITTGMPLPIARPWKRISTEVSSKGSKTTSTRDPTKAASTSKVLPCNETVAVLVTVRTSDHKNASCSAAGVGRAGAPAASSRSMGASPVSEWTRR